MIQFSVNSKGKVVDVKVIKSPNSLLNNAAIKAVMASDTWEPAIQEGRKVKQQFIMPIIFNLE
jgi:TonB family protein